MHAEAPANCENCTTSLQGSYCHVCGQHAANPLRHFGHAVEEVFESFWHLDGRIFRTFRDLLVPGRVACNYLAGHRVRYIAPLRLFVIISLLTFFFGQMLAANVESGPAVQFDGTPSADGSRTPAFADAATEAEVRRELEEQLAALRTARENTGFVPNAAKAMQAAENQLRADADLRIAQLARAGARKDESKAARGGPANTANAGPDADARTSSTSKPSDASARPPSAAPAPASPATPAEPTTQEPDAEGTIDRFLRNNMASARLRDPKLRWHHETNPADVAWLPTYLDTWFNTKLHVIGENAKRYSKADGNFMVAFVAAMPTALFLMMPVFALLLKLFYIRHRRGVLEHLVVALYSHVFLLLAVLTGLVLGAIAPDDGGGVLAALPGLGIAAIVIYVPVYLLLMQHRVYAQGWLKTIVKYVLIGSVYFWLATAATVIAAVLPFLGST